MNKRIKDDIKLIGGILGLITVVFLLSGGFDFLASAIRPDDSIVYDDFEIPRPELLASNPFSVSSYDYLCNIESWSGVKDSCKGKFYQTSMSRGGFESRGIITQGKDDPSVGGSNTDTVLALYTSASSGVSVQTIENISGYNLKIYGRAQGSNGVSTVSLGGCGVSIPTAVQTRDFFIEIIQSRTEANTCETFLDGTFIGRSTYPQSGAPLIIRNKDAGTSNNHATIIKQIRYTIPFSSCSLGNGTILGVEVFSSGKTFSLYSFQRPVQKFCTQFPALIQRSNGFDATAEVYEQLRRGEVLTVPENEQWAVFYLFRNDGTLPQCQTGQAYDFGKSSCTTSSGFAFFCKGELDTNTGICSDTLQDRCDNVGGFWNTQEKICVYAFPVQALCAESSATFVPLYSKCISYLLNPSACSLAGGTYNTIKSWCEFPPVTTITCPLLELENGGFVETAYNPLTGQCQGSAPTAITCPLLELENGGSVQTVYNPSIGKCEGNAPAQINFKAGECNGVLEQVSAGVYTCTIPPTTTFKAGECTGILSQVSAGVYTCTIPPIVSYEKPSCAGKLEEVQKGVYVCKLTATQVQQNITIQEPIVIQPFIFERIPAWVIYSVSAAIILAAIYLIRFRKKK